MFDQGINQNFGFDNSIVGNNNTIENDMNVDVNMMGTNNMMQGGMMPNMMPGNMGGCPSPINEGVQQRIVNRTFLHEVPQECQFLIDHKNIKEINKY